MSYVDYWLAKKMGANDYIEIQDNKETEGTITNTRL